MPNVNSINNFLEETYPLALQESWDSSGCFFSKKKSPTASGVLICLDINEDTLKNAIVHGCNLIVSHHPIFFKKEKLTQKEKKIIKSIKSNHITVICHHTNFDNNKSGMNSLLAKKMGLNNAKPISKNNHSILIADVRSTTTSKLSKLLSKRFPLNKFYFSKPFAGKKINCICLTAGSGFSIFKLHMKKLEKKVDAFITGDLKWHDWQFAKNHRINVVDAGHDIENIFVDHYALIIKKKFEDLKIIKNYNYSDLELA